DSSRRIGNIDKPPGSLALRQKSLSITLRLFFVTNILDETESYQNRI
ncbi:MAG: hypothetical protein ACI9XP_001760, partial [Lentimonas sp.]